MKCKQVQALFSEMYDAEIRTNAITNGTGLPEELEEADAEAVSAHLKHCPDCMAEYVQYRALMDEVRALPVPDLPPGFHKTAMSRIRSQSRRPLQKVQRGRRKSWLWGLSSAAACFILLSVMVATGVMDWSAIATFNQSGPHIEERYADPGDMLGNIGNDMIMPQYEYAENYDFAYEHGGYIPPFPLAGAIIPDAGMPNGSARFSMPETDINANIMPMMAQIYDVEEMVIVPPDNAANVNLLFNAILSLSIGGIVTLAVFLVPRRQRVMSPFMFL